MLELPSNPQNIEKVQRFVKEIASEFRLSPDLHGDILTSLTEAVNNAIRHGNHCDESKTVQIALCKNRGSLDIRVSDQGHGFDYRQVPDPTAPENICNDGGRGVFLIHQLCDRVRYANNGSTVEMRFKISKRGNPPI